MKKIFAVMLIVSMLLVPASNIYAQTGTTITVLVYENIDTPTWFNYNVDECVGNVTVRISFKPDNSPFTQYADRDTPNVNGVQGSSAYTVCVTSPVTYYGPGTISVYDVESGITTTTHTSHYNNYGNKLIRLRVL